MRYRRSRRQILTIQGCAFSCGMVNSGRDQKAVRGSFGSPRSQPSRCEMYE